MTYQLHQGNCLEVMEQIPDKSVDLVLTDPPYNIKKAEWDTWKTIDEYVEFIGKAFIEIQRVLKDNGSFYFFHNDFLQIVELQNWINKNTTFVFKSFLVWNKRYNGSPRKYYFDNVIAGNTNRNHRQLSEYCLYYTFQDETGLNKILPLCFNAYLNYMTKEKNKLGWTNKQINDFLGYKSIASHWFWQDSEMTKQSQPRFISFNDYKKLQETGYFKKPYEDLKKEYEDLRYVFNNQKTHHDILDFEVAKKQGHITPKPVDLLEYLIKTSSNEGMTVLDCFMGSGSTGVACMNTNRNFIGIELDENYFKIAEQRLKNTIKNI